MNKYDTDFLDEEEKELIESIDGLDYETLSKSKAEEQDKIQEAAREFVKNEKKMNIRIDPYELEKIKEYASKEGLKYQTFIKSVVHKYITGQLVDKDKIAG
ncbi:MAG: antitoxin [Spirochaetia bacterium]|nr:antitoxin [Spirochaetia bacterium]